MTSAHRALYRPKMRTRSVLAILCCLLGAGLLVVLAAQSRPGDHGLFAGMSVVVVVAAVLLALPPLWAALAGRGVVWTILAMTTLFDSVGRPEWTMTAAALALCAALLVLGRPLDRSAAAFQPSHHRGPLTLTLVLGFADVVTLIVWSILAFAGPRWTTGAMFVGFAAAIAVSLVGLYRLRAWGFLLNLVVNLAVVAVMLTDALHLDFVRLVFLVPAIAQILLALPVLVAIIRRRPFGAPSALVRLGAFVPAVAVLIMAALNVQAWFGEPVLITLVRWGRYHL